MRTGSGGCSLHWQSLAWPGGQCDLLQARGGGSRICFWPLTDQRKLRGCVCLFTAAPSGRHPDARMRHLCLVCTFPFAAHACNIMVTRGDTLHHGDSQQRTSLLQFDEKILTERFDGKAGRRTHHPPPFCSSAWRAGSAAARPGSDAKSGRAAGNSPCCCGGRSGWERCCCSVSGCRGLQRSREGSAAPRSGLNGCGGQVAATGGG